MMRAMPNMKVFVPCDAIEAKKATLAAAKLWGPVYLRFGREKSSVFTTEATPFAPGKAEVFWQSRGPEVLIIGCGALVYNALIAARELEKEKISTVVLNCHTIKPIDDKKITELAKKCGAVVTVEEHQVHGGLGGAIAELLAQKAPTPMEFVGMQDAYGQSGTAKELYEHYGMGVSHITAAVKRVCGRYT